MLQITKLDTLVVPAHGNTTWLFVEVHTNAGLVGVGEASLSRLDVGVIEQVRDLQAMYIGQDPLAIREKQSLMLRNPWHRGRIRHTAISAIEQALWDVAGQQLGVSCAVLLGGLIRNRIRLYANIEPATITKTVAAYQANAQTAVDQGFTAVKINALDSLPQLAQPAETLEWQTLRRQARARVGAVREIVGDEVEILVDFQARMRQVEAALLAEDLAEYRPYWLQEPLVPGDPERLRELRTRVGTRIADGDQEIGMEPFRKLLEARAVDVVRPDVKWVGGILPAKKVAAMAEAFDIECAPHNLSSPVATAASAQLSANLANFTILEYPWGGPPWRHELVRGSETVEAGHLVLSERPGLGIEWDPAAVRHLVERLG